MSQPHIEDLQLEHQTTGRAFGGFTLSELLVSMAVLGLIAAFAIPSILAAVGENSKKALLKETFNMISNGLREGVDMGTLRTTNDINYYRSKFNAIKICNNASAEGCWTGTNIAQNTPTAAAIELATGAIVTDIENLNTGADRYYIDVNGRSGPNQKCDDQFPIVVSVGNPANPGSTTAIDGITLRLGEVKYSNTESGFPSDVACPMAQFPN